MKDGKEKLITVQESLEKLAASNELFEDHQVMGRLGKFYRMTLNYFELREKEAYKKEGGVLDNNSLLLWPSQSYCGVVILGHIQTMACVLIQMEEVGYKDAIKALYEVCSMVAYG